MFLFEHGSGHIKTECKFLINQSREKQLIDIPRIMISYHKILNHYEKNQFFYKFNHKIYYKKILFIKDSKKLTLILNEIHLKL